MVLSKVKIGEKFIHLDEKTGVNKPYIRIDLDLTMLFPALSRDWRAFSNLVPVLDLTTYKICCINGSYEVELDRG